MRQQSIEGSIVTVSCYGGKTASVFVYRDLGEVLLVCKPEEMATSAKQKREPVTVGFKRASIVKDTEKLVA